MSNTDPYQFLRELIHEKTTFYPFRFPCLEQCRWKIVAWFIVRYNQSPIYNSFVDKQLNQMMLLADSFVEKQYVYAAIHFLATWYIRITTEIKNINLITKLYHHTNYDCVRAFCLLLKDSSECLLTNWIFHLSSLRTNIHKMQQSHIWYSDANFLCMNQFSNPTKNYHGLVSSYLVDKKTNIAYNTLLEEVGMYCPQFFLITFHNNFQIQSYFGDNDVSFCSPEKTFLLSPMTKKEKRYHFDRHYQDDMNLHITYSINMSKLEHMINYFHLFFK
jgi:hypothetical protein